MSGRSTRGFALWALVFAHVAIFQGLLAPTPLRADYKQLYVLGLRAVDREHWRQASILMARAIEEQPESGGLVRPYGTWMEPYVPHYYLGLARFHMQRYGGAASAWDEEKANDPIHFPRNKKKLLNLRDMEGQVPGLVSAQNEHLRIELLDLLGDLEGLVLGNQPGWRGGGRGLVDPSDEAGEPETPGVSLEMAREWLSRLEAAANGSGDPRSGAEFQQELQSLIASMRQKVTGWTALSEIVAREQKRYEALLNDYRFATSLLATSCSHEAISLLQDLEPRVPRSTAAGQTPILVDLRLSQAYLACGDLPQAEQYLDMSRERALASEAEREVMRGAVDTRMLASESPILAVGRPPSEAWEAVSDYLVAETLVHLGDCVPEAQMKLLSSNEILLANENRVLAEDVIGAQYAPELVEAEALLACADVAAASEALERARASGRGEAEEVRDLATRLAASGEANPYEGSYALLLIGSDYSEEVAGWSDLDGAASDGPEIARVLRNDGFEVDLIENPTSKEFRRGVDRFVSSKGRNPGNRLLIYWAGHGWTENNEDTVVGYVVPVDSPNPEVEDQAFEYLVNMDEFEGWAKSIQAAHAMFVFDSCFGGTVFKTIEVGHEFVPTEVPSRPLEEKVKMFLTAGQDHQIVPDFSLFRRAFVEGLAGRADCNLDGLVVGAELGAHVSRSLREQGSPTIPVWGRASGLGTGDMVFRSARDQGCDFNRAPAHEPSVTALRAELRYWRVAWASGTLARLRAYLERYPGGVFQGLAAAVLEEASDLGS